MTYKYMSTEAPAVFPASTALASAVHLNTDKTRFKLLTTPSMRELRAAIDSYAAVRGEALWKELTTVEDGTCKLVATAGNSLLNVNRGAVSAALGEDITVAQLGELVTGKNSSRVLNALKPKSVAEMEALYRLNRDRESAISHDYLSGIAKGSESAFDFYGTVIETLFEGSRDVNPKLGNIPKTYYQARVYEFLGYSATKGWLLFPFVHPQSGIREHLHLSHRSNQAAIFAKEYRPPEVDELLAELANMEVAKTTEVNRVLHLRNLMLASNLRSLEQVTTPLLAACVNLVLEAKQPMTVQQAGMQRNTYNALLRLHNSRCAGAPTQALLFKKRDAVTLDDFSSFSQLRAEHPHMSEWSQWFEEFVKETKDSQGQLRKTACSEFADFLATLASPPLSPLEVTRSLVNDYRVGSAACYRGYLATKLSSAGARNGRLAMLGQFFDFVKDRLLARHKGNPKDAPWLAQPVDLKLDRFSDTLKSGTTRKAIAAHVMEEMRNVLTEDDYAWPKSQGGWAHLVNEKTKALEHVWCPSAALLLYTLLTLPLRSLQARLFDSGEADAFIFDFERRVMVPNPNQVAIGGVVDPNRREGVLQVIPSGMLDVSDVIGIWVPVNKTSAEGYHIPWVSDELLEHLRHQYEWIRVYAAHPNPHGIIEVQGHRNQPEEWMQSQSKFLCLFRDPSVVRTSDPSLPVSRQKLLKLWVELCAETERRINSQAKGEGQRVQLVAKEDGKARALHDIHTLRVSGITDLLDRGVPLNIVSEYVAGHATYIMTLWYDKPTPGQMRQVLKNAEATAGRSNAAIPKFTEAEAHEMRDYLVTNSSYKGMYTGFDAMTDNAGLLQFRLGGICPGTRCEEGGLTSNGRIAPVPVGDRGPSCPQCRFWLTGPAFLLGQCIEGNQLILKIRKKIQALDALRASILDAEDSEDFAQADLLRGQTDVEERQLNDMLTEWWHRMKLYEASVHKLDDYKQFLADGKADGESAAHLMLVTDQASQDLTFSFKQATQLELDHFLSTCAELLPDYAMESKAVALDLEMAVGKFLAINEHSDLTSLYFKLTDDQRLSAANLAIELMLGAAEDPSQASDLLEGRTPLGSLPHLQQGLSELLLASSKATTRSVSRTIPIKALK
ncbi:MAG: hypothetical protein JZU45_07620 [Methyloversatilis discipulorum]|uniref:VPA1269 family protein n=1 Tax=Methyloversatilis discipulorum TaxID=1119528 RepID=UPI0026ECD637|nr:VPA1269 family protein [Methyloversatilis discipulorum]MBV5285935.1 hypothetical protein [Methyloversatilis discipulorum]